MQRIAIAAIAIVGMLWAAGTVRGQDESASPTEQFKALLKKHQQASSSGRVLTDDERKQFMIETYEHRNRIAEKLVASLRNIPTIRSP